MSKCQDCKTCQSCQHFIQHYIRRGKRYFAIKLGHCIHPRIKNRAVTDPACRHFLEAGE